MDIGPGEELFVVKLLDTPVWICMDKAKLWRSAADVCLGHAGVVQ